MLLTEESKIIIILASSTGINMVFKRRFLSVRIESDALDNSSAFYMWYVSETEKYLNSLPKTSIFGDLAH